MPTTARRSAAADGAMIRRRLRGLMAAATTVFSSSDKLKLPKTAVRASETIPPAKRAQQQPQFASQYPCGGQVSSDAPKTSLSGKFLVLKPVWEYGVSSMAKDVSSTTNTSRGVANSQDPVAASVPDASFSNPNHPSLSAIEVKTAVLAYNPRSIAEKKASMAQIRSRIDFYNLMRKKKFRELLCYCVRFQSCCFISQHGEFWWRN